MKKGSKISKNRINCLLDQKGMTMTEVVIAFLLLTIIFAMLYNSIRFASNMMKRATDMDGQNAVFEENAAQKFSGKEDAYSSSALGSDVVRTDAMTLTFTEQIGGVNAPGGVSCQIQVKGKRVQISDGTTEMREISVYSTDP